MIPETYKVKVTNTDPDRDDIEIDPLIYQFDNGDYFDELMEPLSDELIYMEPGHTMTVTIERLS